MTGALVGILLGAGAGRRFGGAKLLHRLPDGRTIGVAAAASLRPACDRLLAVVRRADDELAALLAGAGCEIVVCPEADAGMGYSLAAGVRASADASAWLVALADMPFIAGTSHLAVASRLRAGASLAASRYQGQRGHPVGFSGAWLTQLAALGGDQGARGILRLHSGDVTLCDVDDPGVIQDIDRPQDLARFVRTPERGSDDGAPG